MNYHRVKILEGKSKIVITGGGQCIGRVLPKHFAERGYQIFLIDVNEEGLKRTVQEHLKKHSDRIGWATCDLGDPSAVRETIKEAADFLDNRIDFVVNNAGISYANWADGKTIEGSSTLEIWKKYMDVNLTSIFALSQACIPYMKVEKKEDKQKLPGSKIGVAGPCIVMVSSFRGLVSDPNQEGYAASKVALIGLTIAKAVSLQHFRIRVNAVSPGRVKVQHENKEADKRDGKRENGDGDAETHVSNRAGMPEDITEAVEYLLRASFVTGQNLVVDGGVTVLKGSA